MPIIDAASGDSLSDGQGLALSTDLMQELELAGSKSRVPSGLVLVELSDGRRLLVPIEEIDIRQPEFAQFQY